MGAVDWAILSLYLAFVLGIGVIAAQRARSGADFFLAGRFDPMGRGARLPVGEPRPQEVIRMGASGGQIRHRDLPCFLSAAIPAMVFVGVFMMPFL